MTMPFLPSRKRLSELTEREIVALAIASEEDDARIYRNWAAFLRKDYPGSPNSGGRRRWAAAFAR